MPLFFSIGNNVWSLPSCCFFFHFVLPSVSFQVCHFFWKTRNLDKAGDSKTVREELGRKYSILSQQLLVQLFYLVEGELQFAYIVRTKKFRLFPLFKHGKNCLDKSRNLLQLGSGNPVSSLAGKNNSRHRQRRDLFIYYLIVYLLTGWRYGDRSTAALHRLAGPRRSNATDVASGFPPEIPQLRRRAVGRSRHHPLQCGGRTHGHVHSAGLPP